MNFANRPTIETRLWKKLFENLVVANLNVSTSNPKAPQLGLSGDSTSVSMMEYPTNTG
jgi:hypothetical protein